MCIRASLAISQLYMHTIGTPQTQDLLLLEFPTNPNWLPRAEVTDDGRFIVVSISHSCDSVSHSAMRILWSVLFEVINKALFLCSPSEHIAPFILWALQHYLQLIRAALFLR